MLAHVLSTALLLGSFLGGAQAATTCSVLDYGGKADNSTDLSPALLSAWNNCVKTHATSNRADTILLVPSGNFLLKTATQFDKSTNFNFHVLGNIYLPFDANLAGNMLFFSHCSNLLVDGSGSIYGNGYRYRPGGDLGKYPSRPRLLRFESCTNVELTGITLYDAPMFHVTMIGNNMEAHDMKIIATNIGETDGFDMSGNNNYVHDVSVENGDECVTVKSPTNGFLAERITCIFTAGCNVGSFGSGATGVNVQNVVYRDVTISNSDAGIMLKSYPNCAGTVKNLTYSNFKMSAAAYPLDINSFWEGGTSDTGSLSITDVSFNNITGTGTPTRPAVLLNCNKATPCKNIKFSGISLSNAKADSFTNACGTGRSGLPAC